MYYRRPMAERLLVTFVVSKEQSLAACDLSRSLVLIGDLTPRAVVTTLPGGTWSREFQRVEEGFIQQFDALGNVFPDADRLVLHPSVLAFDRLDRLFDRFQNNPAVIQPGATLQTTAMLYLAAKQKPIAAIETDDTVMNRLDDPLKNLRCRILENLFAYTSGGEPKSPVLFDTRGQAIVVPQNRQLHWVADYERRHPFGYMPITQRWQRSIERRLLKSRGRG
jgi:hypothetical protein